MLSEYRGEEHFLLVRECLDSLELPELYSLGKNAFSLTIKNAITENSPFFYNSLIWELDYSIEMFLYFQEKQFTNNSLLFTVPANFFFLKKIQEHNPLKEFTYIELLYHCKKCEEEKEKGNARQCKSFFFTVNKFEASTVKDLKKDLRSNLAKLTPGKVLIALVFQINCGFPERLGHSTVLVIYREVDSFRVFYCDSAGDKMPWILKTLLKKTFSKKINDEAHGDHEEKYCLNYFSQRQQYTPFGCAVFSAVNSASISDKMLKKASLREIEKALRFRPSENYFREKTWEFFNVFDKNFCYHLIEKIEVLVNSLNSFLRETCSTTLPSDRNNIKDNCEKLQKIAILLKNILETEKRFNGINKKSFFAREFLSCDHENKQQCFYKKECFFWNNIREKLLSSLKSSFKLHCDALIESLSQKEKETNCTSYKEKIKIEKEIICLKNDFEWKRVID